MTWTADQAGVLLGTIAVADGRFAGLPEQERADMAAWWASRMNHHDVDPEFAMACVARHYDRDTRKITVADILVPWGRHRDTEEAKQAAAERAELSQAQPIAQTVARLTAGAKSPEWFRPYMTAVENVANWKEARSHGAGREWEPYMSAALAAIEALPYPEIPEPAFHDLKRDERQRDCGTPGCPCPHQECRAGFMDAETQTGAVRRCDWCYEAVTMASELAPKRKGRR